MVTIVLYTDERLPENRYPPSHHLAAVGEPLLLRRHGRARVAPDGWALGVPVPALPVLRVCRPGEILRALPDMVLVASLRELLTRSFARKV